MSESKDEGKRKITSWSVALGVLIIGTWLYGERLLLGVGQNHSLGLSILWLIVLGTFIGPLLMFRKRFGLGVLLLLLGLFEAVTIPSKIRAGYQADLTLCKTNLKQIATAIERYQADHQEPLTSAQLLNALKPDYLSQMPICPAARESTYVVVLSRLEDGSEVLVKCSGGHHADLGIPEDHPAYSSVEGLIER